MHASITRAGAAVVLAALAIWPAGAAPQEDASGQIAALKRIAESRPGHAGALYVLATVHARLGKTDEALAWIERLVRLGVGADPASEEAFAPLKGNERFEALAREARERSPRVGSSDVAFKLAERDLIPEGVAYDAKSKTFFVGSTHKRKIVAVDASGRSRDFTASGEGGIWDVLGMKVDEKRGVLWAASPAGRSAGAAEGSSGLFAYDLKTGKLREKHVVDASAGKHLFNDVAIDARGAVYVTDTLGSMVHVLAPGAKLEPLLERGRVAYPNGIALSDDGQYLFVAHFSGVARIRVSDRAVTDLQFPGDVVLTGFDGLYWHEGDLVGIQNWSTPGRVVRLRLDPERERIVEVRVLESGHPTYEIPTTGAIAEGALFYIANSQLRKRDDDGRIADPSALREPVILKLKLQKN